MMARFITVFRDPKNALDWDFHISEFEDDLKHVHHNLIERGVTTGASYALGDKVADLAALAKKGT